MALNQTVRNAARRIQSGLYLLRRRFGLVQSTEKLVADSQAYWSTPTSDGQRHNAHWRGHGSFAGQDDRWLAVGRQNLEIFRTFATALGLSTPMDRVIEWGCGGGANAVHIAPLCREFVGVDLSLDTLDECARQVAAIAPETSYRPVLIAADTPETAVADAGGPCDLFLCCYVFELLPSVEYARRILSLAARLLAPGGMAVIQIKYRTAEGRTASRPWNYVGNLAHNTTYGIDEFWNECLSVGLKPRLVTLVPKQELVNDERYAYFAIQREQIEPR